MVDPDRYLDPSLWSMREEHDLNQKKSFNYDREGESREYDSIITI